MTQAARPKWAIKSASDPMGFTEHVADAVKHDRLMGNSINLALRGVWRFNGIDADANPVDLFMGVLMGMGLLVARCEYDQRTEAVKRAAAGLTDAQIAKAKRMARAYDSAMADAERTIKGQTQQLELF